MTGQLDGDLACASSRHSPPFPLPITWHVSLAGRFAMDALRPDMLGRVIAVFRRSFYVETARSDILCIASSTLRPGPLNLLCDFTDQTNQCFPGLQRGDLTRCSGDALTIGDHWSVRLETARIWKPHTIRLPVRVVVLARGLDTLRRLRRNFADGATDGGQLVRAGHDGGSPAAVQKASNRPIADLREWLGHSLAPGAATRRPPSSARALLGLGPGLTPSGDDFLCGVMLALMTFGYQSLARSVEILVSASARERTSAISAAHLRSAAHGEGSAAIHGLLAAMCGQSKRSIGAWVREVDQIGHTSGWDTVAGIELTLSAVLEDALDRQSPAAGCATGTGDL